MSEKSVSTAESRVTHSAGSTAGVCVKHLVTCVTYVTCRSVTVSNVHSLWLTSTI